MSTCFWLMILMLQANATVASSESVITLTTNVTFSDPKGVCPVRAPVQFRCDATDTALLTWKLNNATLRILSSSTTTGGLMATSHSRIQVQLVSLTLTENAKHRANLTSRLVVDSSVLMSGDQISCVSSNGAESLDYTIRAPPPEVTVVPKISKEGGNSVMLTLQWNNTFTETHQVDEYCVIAPAGSVCQSKTTCLTPDTDYECSGLVAGNQYGFVIYAKNCEDQSGTNITSIIDPQVPGESPMCSSVPVYDQSTNRLITIQNTWTVAPNPMEVTSGHKQDVLQYNIRFESSGSLISRGSKNISATDVCTAESCRYNLSTSFFGSHYTLSVAAENIAGLGGHLTCTPDHISTSNTMVQVTANTSTPEHATVECLFLVLPARCEVCYGIISNCHNLTCLPPVPANADGRATVSLPQLEKKLKYCYTAAAIVGADHDDDVEELAVVVQGSFSTACDMKDLKYRQSTNMYTKDTKNKTVDIIKDPRCTLDSVGSLPIPNGVVCYNGSTSGSAAYYICNRDYQVPGYSDCKHKCNLRECQGDGHWSGETLPCLNETCSSCSVGVSLCFVFSLVAGVITTIIIAMLVRRHTLKQQLTKPEDTSSSSHHGNGNELPNYLEYAEDRTDLDISKDDPKHSTVNYSQNN